MDHQRDERAVNRPCPHCKTNGPKDLIPSRSSVRWFFKHRPTHEAMCPNCLRIFDPAARQLFRRFRETLAMWVA
ncbi:MAG: hypothetical protein IPP80_12130 [Ignavibacteria bacterium]|nr:hypothetical protein [Ignavibacteria bacterium]